MTYRVLVCGGRHFDDRGAVYRTLHALQAFRPSLCIITGGATGADNFARQWAIDTGSELSEYEAEWEKHGRAAGPIRNQRMLDEGKPSVVYAFPGGKGTADMVRRAKAAGIPVVEPYASAQAGGRADAKSPSRP